MATLFIQDQKVTSPDIYELMIQQVVSDRPARTRQLIDRREISYCLKVYVANHKYEATDINIFYDLGIVRQIATVLGFDQDEIDRIVNVPIAGDL